MRVRVRERAGLPQHVAPLELLDNERIGLLHELPANDRHVRGKFTARSHRLHEREPVALSGA
jgi:hypothetical protein